MFLSLDSQNWSSKNPSLGKSESQCLFFFEKIEKIWKKKNERFFFWLIRIQKKSHASSKKIVKFSHGRLF